LAIYINHLIIIKFKKVPVKISINKHSARFISLLDFMKTILDEDKLDDEVPFLGAEAFREENSKQRKQAAQALKIKLSCCSHPLSS